MLHLYNTGEVGEVLGVSRARVSQLASRLDFPQPQAVTYLGTRELRLWALADIMEWDRTADRNVGRPVTR